jgi:predicted Zn-dependent protease with MMP-like domain
VDDHHGRFRRTEPDTRRGPRAGYRTASRARFERLVRDAVADLPAELREQLARVELSVEDVPPAGGGAVPLATLDMSAAVPRLLLYRRPLEMRAESKADLVDLVRDAVAREVGGWGR